MKKEDNKCNECAFAVKNAYCGLRGYTSKFPKSFCSAFNSKAPSGFELQEDGYFDWVKEKEIEYRPFKDAVEAFKEMQKHSPFGWIQSKNGSDAKQYNLYIDTYGTQISDGENGYVFVSYSSLYKDYIFVDGQPFGIEVGK